MLDDQEGDSESEQIQNLTWNEGKEETVSWFPLCVLALKTLHKS